jgi:hypothetical protein
LRRCEMDRPEAEVYNLWDLVKLMDGVKVLHEARFGRKLEFEELFLIAGNTMAAGDDLEISVDLTALRKLYDSGVRPVGKI